MKLSLNWIKQYTDVDLPVDELVRKIGAQLGEVESVENLGPKYEGALIVKVVTCDDHPNADRLHVVTVDDGGVTPDVKRNESGNVQVVCGAANVHADMLAVWLPPSSTVPESYDKDPFVLEARDLRGVVSNGMLASPRELALGDSHEGILEIDPTEWSPRADEVKPGAKFGHVYGLDDHVIDIENKMFTHRPDLFGQLGLAREVAGINHQKFSSPDWYKNVGDVPSGSGLELAVSNEAPEVVPRFMTLTVKNVTVKPSPLWLQCELVRVGAKPINNIVDVTNYIMLLTAQPAHAYDYDKLRGGALMARLARPGEKVGLLNHKTYELGPNDIVIADGEGPVGLAGVMGGGDSEVSDATKNIVLECATFDMYAVRRSAMRHGVFTDALTRFNKGQSPLQNPHVLGLLLQSIQDVAGGEVAGPVHDLNRLEGRAWVHPPVPVTTEFIDARLGLKLSADEMKTLLENVEFNVEVDNDTMTVTTPFWRTDIETREDVVEEVGRLYGFDKLPQELPRRSIKPVAKNQLMELKQSIRENLVKSGANEVLTYSFVHGGLLDKVGQDKTLAFKLGNALSPDLQYYRLSLTPSLLDKVHPNIKAGHESFALFELGKTHYVGEMDPDDADIPNEDDHVAFVIAWGSKQQPSGAPYYATKTYLSRIVDLKKETLVPLRDFDLSTDEWGRQLTAPYEPSRSAVIVRNDQIWGVVGEFKSAVRRSLKLPDYVAGFEVHLDLISGNRVTYTSLSRYPKVEQDITLRVVDSVSYGALLSTLQKALAAAAADDTHVTVEPRGIYQPGDNANRNITFRVSVVSYQKTLTDSEVSSLLGAAAEQCRTELSAQRV